MATYVMVDSNKPLHSWDVTDSEAVRIGVPNARSIVNAHVQAAPGQNIWNACREKLPAFFMMPGHRFVKTTLEAGEYYPRIARPAAQHGVHGQEAFSPSWQVLEDELAIARSQYAVLLRQLHRICETVHPCPETWGSFGHDIRNLLILACTEVESQWRAVLMANGVQQTRYTTADYVKLAPAMRLSEYSLSFPQYPWLEARIPFAGWRAPSNPTKDLPWFDAYNAVKHDRERNFNQATLENVFDAVSANAVMLAGQFGFAYAIRMSAHISTPIEVETYPQWEPEEVYVHPEHGASGFLWNPINYQF